MPFFSCTVNEIGPAANGTETPAPVIYVNLTDNGGSFVNQWFHAAQKSKTEMLSVGLAAISENKPVEVAIDSPNVPYSSVSRMYLIASGGGTKLAFNQNIIGIPTAGRTLDPIDISQFEKIRFSVTVNGTGSIQFYLLSGGAFPFPDGYALDDFSVGASGTLTRTYDVAGLSLLIQMIPTDSNNQAIIGVYGH